MFTPLPSLLGGLLIGLGAAALLLGYGRIAGISGILGDALSARDGQVGWRLLFLGGLVGGGVLLAALAPAAFPAAGSSAAPAAIARLAVAGLLVGVGTRLGAGCTSGHGVCGLGRLSLRSLAAVMTFMATGALTVFVLRHVLAVAS